MSIADRTRSAVRDHPFLFEALRADVVNFTAVARFLDVGETEAVAAALRRFSKELDDYVPPSGDARVSMESGLGDVDPSEALLVVGDTALAPGAGSLTGVFATGDVSPEGLGHVLGRCETASIDVEAAGVAGDSLLVVVERRDGPDVVRLLETVF
jgi:hypothetical protein